MDKGIIIKAVSGFYYVETEKTVYECKARGTFRKDSLSPLAGDIVEFSEISDSKGVIEHICERKNFLDRPPVANIDKMFIVSSYTTPAPSPLIIDSMTVIADDKSIEPVIVFNKCDMGGFGELPDIYASAGFRVYTVSAKEGMGLEAIKAELSGCVSVFAGNTGVGKSSLLNALYPDLALKTGDVSQKLGRGRHTTRHVELFPLGYGTYVTDTPGFSSLDIEQSGISYKENLQFAFREFADYIGKCKFTSCTHTGEKGCAVVSALEHGRISQSRYDSYKYLYAVLAKRKDWEIRQSQ